MPAQYPGNAITKAARAKAGGGFESAIEAPSGTALTAPERRFTFARTFEGTVGETTYNGDGMDGAAGRTTFSTEQVYQGATSGRCQLLVTDTDAAAGGTSNGGFGNWGGSISIPNKLYDGDEVFVRFRMYFPAGFSRHSGTSTDRIKFFRIKSTNASGGNAGYLDIYWPRDDESAPYFAIKEGIPGQWKAIGSKMEFPYLFDQWVTFNLHYRISTDPQIGFIRLWINDAFVEQQDMQTLSGADHSLDFFYLFTYWNGVVPQDQHCYTDDWRVTSDRDQTTTDPVTGHPWIGV